MSRKDSTGNVAGAGSAAHRFVSADAGEQGADAALASWLDERPGHERALERVELASALARQLAADPSSALYAEAALAARLASRRRPWSRALAWGGALAASVLVGILVLRHGASPAVSLEQTSPIDAARVVTFDAPGAAVAVLPTGAVVDAGAVAVLPFVENGDGTLAAGLERDLVAALRDVPGLYVIADDAVRPYAATDLPASELGGLLGARGIVNAAVELGGGRVRISAQLRDAATGATLWRTDVERPVDELSAVRHELAQRVAATMLDASLREQVVRTDRAGAPVSSSKPILQ